MLFRSQKNLRVGLSEDPDVLDPVLSRTGIASSILMSVCDTLLNWDPQRNVVPGLAESWSWAPDNLSLTLNLRKGVVFHDGTPFNAEAVKVNLDRARLLPESARKADIAQVKNVVVKDPYTVVLELTSPAVPLLTALTDRIGRRRLLLVFATLYGLGGILPFFLDSFEALFAGRLLLGVGEAFILTVGNTLLGDYFQKEERAKWLMWQSLIGPAAGVFLISSSGRLSMIQWNLPFLIYGLALLMAAFAFFTAFEPDRSGEAQPDEPGTATMMAFPSGVMVRIAVSTFLLSALYFVYTLQFSLALDEMGVKKGSELGNLTALASLGVPVGALLFKFIAKRGNAFQFSVVFSLLGLGMVGIGLNLGLVPAIASAFVQQLGAGMVIPVLISWSLRELPERFRGRGMGWWCSAFFLGQFVSPFFVTLLRGWTGSLLTTFLVCGLL